MKLFYRDISEGFELATSTEKYMKIVFKQRKMFPQGIMSVTPVTMRLGHCCSALPTAHAAP